MSYVKQNFVDGQVLTASQLDHMEDGIVAAENAGAKSRALKVDVFPTILSWAADTDFDTIWKKYYSGGQIICCLETDDRRWLEMPFIKEADGVITCGAVIDGEEWRVEISEGSEGKAVVTVSNDSVSTAVRYDCAQELTNEQKAQARENIGAVDAVFVNDCIESSRYETVLTTIDPTETLEAYILLQNTGALTQLASGDKSYVVKKYDVAGISTVAITASAAYSAYLYSFCNASGGIIGLSESAATGSTVTEIVEQVVQVPENAAVLYVSYIVSASNVATVQNIERKLIGDTSKWSGKKWVCIGDSLTEVNIRTTMHYHDYVAEATGISVVNLGVSGTGYAKGSNTFNSRIDSVPTDADVVTIFGSGNDLSAGIDLGEITDTGTETLCGCINTTIDSLIARMPAVQLGVVTPTPWVGQQPGAGKPMEAYANAIVEICKARSIPCLDLYHCSNLRPWTEEGRAACYSKDDGNGVHPDETGHKLIAPRFKVFVESLLM